MTEKPEAKCPCCWGALEHFEDQDGAPDYQRIDCGWREDVPSSEHISAALVLHKESQPGSDPSVKPHLPAEGEIDLKLPKQQAALLGKLVDKTSLTSDERSCLEGLRELVHRIIDCVETAPDLEAAS